MKCDILHVSTLYVAYIYLYVSTLSALLGHFIDGLFTQITKSFYRQKL